jgi:hypothetical protein
MKPTKLKSITQVVGKQAAKRLTQAIAVRAFAKKAPVLGAIMAYEDVIKKLAHAGHDLLAGHPAGARNELQQAITHAVGAGVNLIGGVSLIGMTTGLVAQTLAQRHAASIAATKPNAPLETRTLYGKLADQAGIGASVLQKSVELQQNLQQLSQSADKKASVVKNSQLKNSAAKHSHAGKKKKVA